MNIGIYADGSKARGFGHLFRARRISSFLDKSNKVTFFFNNFLQEDFYHTNNLSSIPLKEIDNLEFDIFIIDSKCNEENLVKKIKLLSKKILFIDSFAKCVENADAVLFPSFYLHDRKIKDVLSCEVKLLVGKNFYPLIYDPKNDYKHDISILITFGGSDPNNITELILDNFPNDYKKNDVHVVIGPGFKEKEYLQKRFPWATYLENSLNLTEFLCKSTKLITALGTTIQECEAFGIETAIICNYEDDLEDITYIKKYSRDPSRWHNCGHFKNINSVLLKEFICSPSRRSISDDFSEWGVSIKNITKI